MVALVAFTSSEVFKDVGVSTENCQPKRSGVKIPPRKKLFREFYFNCMTLLTHI